MTTLYFSFSWTLTLVKLMAKGISKKVQRFFLILISGRGFCLEDLNVTETTGCKT